MQREHLDKTTFHKTKFKDDSSHDDFLAIATNYMWMS